MAELLMEFIEKSIMTKMGIFSKIKQKAVLHCTRAVLP